MPKILGVDIGSLTIKAATYDLLRGEARELEIANHQRQPVQPYQVKQVRNVILKHKPGGKINVQI
ncbi:MAG: hypothetical protein QHH14_10905, partial [Clostridiales bacterium]|nr:hypothetical protein [Clostridiales bacterium]